MGLLFEWQAFHKSHLLKQRVAPSETAMTDVLREVSAYCLILWFSIVCIENFVYLFFQLSSCSSLFLTTGTLRFIVTIFFTFFFFWDGGDATCDLLKKRVCWIIVLIPHAKFLYLTLLKFLDASSSYDISNSVKYFLLQANAQQVILEEHNNALLYLFPSQPRPRGGVGGGECLSMVFCSSSFSCFIFKH